MENDIIKHIKRNYLLDLLNRNQRIDGREFLARRPIEIKSDVISTAEGSALVQLGDTQVLAGTKFEVVEPFPSDPTTGVFITNVEFLPLASNQFEPGPPDENSIEFARVVDRGLRSAELVDLNSFYIEEGKVLGLFLDLYVLDYGGNLFDAGYLAGMAALKSTRMPKIEEASIIRGEYTGKLNINENVVSFTFVKIGNHILLDPNLYEEKLMDSRITIALTKEHIVAMQKGGNGTFKKTDVQKLVEFGFDNYDSLSNLLG